MSLEPRVNVVTLKETTYERPTGLYAVVERCVICNDRHIHAVEEGHRSGHCESRSSMYILEIDRNDPENIRLAEKYGIQL